MRQIRLIIAALLVTSPLAANADVMDVGVWSGGGCCSFGTRGYVFEAPMDFVITGLSFPGAFDPNATLEVLSFNSLPPSFPGTTNDFSSLGFWTGTSSITTSINILAGQIIGVLGYNGSFTPYRNSGGNYATTLGGSAVTLRRLGFQSLGTAANVWTETGTIGVISLEYSTSTAVPEPSTLALLGIGLFGMGLARRRKKV